MSGSIGTLHQTGDDVLNVDWRINSFLSKLQKPRSRGRYYTSPTFKFSQCSWFLQVYIGAKGRDDYPDSFAFNLCKKKGILSTAGVEFKLGIQKADGTYFSRRKPIWFFTPNAERTFRKFFGRSKLVKNKADLLPYNVLTVSCSLKRFPSPTGLDTLASDFGNMLESTNHSDVTIQVQTEVFKAHRNILAARSSVFTAMFEHEMVEKNSGIVEIADCDPESFKDFLQFLYTSRAHITESNVFHLFTTADKYCVQELKLLCTAFLIQNLSVDNLWDVASLGHQCSDNHLNDTCREFFEENAGSVLLTSGWELLMKENYLLANNLLRCLVPKLKNLDVPKLEKLDI